MRNELQLFRCFFLSKAINKTILPNKFQIFSQVLQFDN